MKQITDFDRTKAGFTLAELLVVIIILGIAGAMAIPMMGDSSGFQLTSATRHLQSAMLYAKTRSIAKQKQFRVVFYVNGNSFEIQDESGVVITDPITKKPFRENFSDNPNFNQVSIQSANFDGVQVVRFDHLGSPYSGSLIGGPPLTNGSVTLIAGDKTAVISVEPVTGRIKVTD